MLALFAPQCGATVTGGNPTIESALKGMLNLFHHSLM